MQLTKTLMLIVAEWTICLALPVQVNNNANSGISKPLVHGDIVINTGRSVKNCVDCFWPVSQNGMVLVPYVISSAYTDIYKYIITESMKQMELMSCVKFVQRSTEWDYISIESGSGCSSGVARQGGKQTISLSMSSCMATGSIQHELMHSLGFYHEQSRTDRDNYVEIRWQYITEGKQGNFIIENANNMSLPYDYASVMHYQNTAFTNTPGQATIVAKGNPSLQFGQSTGMSPLDVIKLNKLYNCNVCRTKLTNLSGSFSSDDVSFGQDGSCIWFIQTTGFKLVHLQLSDVKIPTSAGCSDSYIKVYNGNSKSSSVLLDKTCGDIIIPPLISIGNSMLIEFVSNQAPALSKFRAVYKTVSYGGTSVKSSGRVMSPEYRMGYPNNVDAEWSIIAPPQSKVHLQFFDFRLPDCSDCSCDSLTIIDGASTTSPILGKYCYINVPNSLTSSGNVMILKFHSDDSQTFEGGFYISYNFALTHDPLSTQDTNKHQGSSHHNTRPHIWHHLPQAPSSRKTVSKQMSAHGTELPQTDMHFLRRSPNDSAGGKIYSLCTSLTNLEGRVKALEAAGPETTCSALQTVHTHARQLTDLRLHVEDLDSRNRRHNISVRGLHESQGPENLWDALIPLFNLILNRSMPVYRQSTQCPLPETTTRSPTA
ncbi:astacin-like metalloendopeptidase [Pelobates cultripes]|uniref:Metalloendopeptidase n=1 Tax=Pelobates cultripes TaxID=61616 RepID=A0AAD1R9V3_PELCU|nr:astacin-like metalloendopeptidase [Pelobates cultripes]